MELLRAANIHNSYRNDNEPPYIECDIDQVLQYYDVDRSSMTKRQLDEYKDSNAIFKNYVEFFYKKKSDCKKEDAPPEEKILEPLYKICLNSLYGKFGQKHNNKTFYGYNFDLHNEINKEDILKHHLYGFREDRGSIRKIEVFNPDRQVGDLVRISSFITAVARIRLWKVMMYIMYGGATDPSEIKKRLIYYCDTDSIITNFTLPSRLVDSKVLGKWKLEKRSKYGSFILPKFYSLYDDDIKLMEIKSKGITKNNINWEGWFKLLESREFSTKQIQFSKYMGDVYVNPEFNKKIRVSIQKRKYKTESLFDEDNSESFLNENEYNTYLERYFK